MKGRRGGGGGGLGPCWSMGRLVPPGNGCSCGCGCGWFIERHGE